MISPICLEAAVVVLGIFLLMFDAFVGEKDKTFVALTGIIGLSLVLVLSFFLQDPALHQNASYSRFYTIDSFALFFKRFALITTIIVLVMSLEYRSVIQKFIFGANLQAGLGEFYCLPVFTCAGLMWIASAVDFVFIFVSIELVTVSFYVLVAYMRRSNLSLEAGVKYLILSALSTGFLVYGITWIFGVTGEMNLVLITQKMQSMSGSPSPLLFGFALVVVALGFKIAAAPFQIWVPDVYQGAPTPVTAFLSVGSKAGGFIVLLRLVDSFVSIPAISEKIVLLVTILAAASLIYGNLAAMPQQNLKRLLAYSSIAHAGYLLVALACIGGRFTEVAITYYLASYLLMTLLAFMVIVVVANHSGGDDIAHFNGLARRSPFLAFAMLTSMVSLAGLPLTTGFFGKLFVFLAAIEQHKFVLVVIGAITVAAGFYYYLKVVRAMYWHDPASQDAIPLAPMTKATIGALIAAIFFLGVYPTPIVRMIQPLRPNTLAIGK